MRAYEKDSETARKIQARTGRIIALFDARMLRRASLTLHRWSELECGDGNDYSSWAIERDEATNIPYMVTYPHTGKTRRYRIADREKGALRRVEKFCKAHGFYFFHQTDPRGCALYISAEPMSDSDYSNKGAAIC